jgi:hypothetical protein
VIPADFADLWGADRDRQNAAYQSFLDATAEPVPWAHDVWDEVVANLAHRDNHNRAIAGQLLCNLAAHDTTERVLRDLPALVAVTRDERFVTARHVLKSLWRLGLAGEVQRRAVVAALDARYREAAAEKNGTLIRHDVVESLRKLHDAVADPEVEATARELIGLETDPKYRTKYAKHWR